MAVRVPVPMRLSMTMQCALLLSSSFTCFHETVGFSVPIPACVGRSADRFVPLRMSAAWGDADEESVRRNLLRMDVRNLLTQRSVQSFMFLLNSCRDPHTIRWLEETYGFTNLLEYHGSGAFDIDVFPAWDSVLTNMTYQPSEVVIVRTKGKSNGWSKNNPYIEDRYVEFEIEIDPPALVNRIVSVRDQIAKEWVIDLDTLVTANEMILESYAENTLNDRSGESEDTDSEDDDIPQENPETESLIAPYTAPKKSAYERNAMYLLSNSIASADRSASPHRQGNFDLLILMATQEAIHRLLRQYMQDDSRQVSFTWLRDFYVERVADFFDGNQAYGRADDFIEELMLTSPSLKTTDDGIEVIDPLRVAEDIIQMRTTVAEDYKVIMLNTSKDHMALQRMVLDVRMGKKVDQNSSKPSEVYVEEEIVVKEEVVAEFFNSLDEAGAFE